MNKTYYTPSKHLRGVEKLSGFSGGKTREFCPYLTKRGKGKLSSKVPWDRTCSFPGRFSPKGRWSFLVMMNPYGKEFEKHQRTNIIPWMNCVSIKYLCNNSNIYGQRSITKSYLVHISVTILHQIHILRPIYAEIFGIKTSHGSTFESQAFASQASEKKTGVTPCEQQNPTQILSIESWLFHRDAGSWFMIYVPNIAWWLGSILPENGCPENGTREFPYHSHIFRDSKMGVVLLMVQKSGDHQLSWGWYIWYFIPLFTRFLHIPGGAGFLQSTVWVWERGPMSLGVSENPLTLASLLNSQDILLMVQNSC